MTMTGFIWLSVLVVVAMHFPTSTALLQQSIHTTPVVICPGFGNDQIDYYEPLKQPREVGLVAALERRGFDPSLIFTLPIQRSDWIRVAGGLLDWRFYTNNALPTGNGYGWYLQQFKATVDQAYNANTEDNSRVLVIGHSAGGWLARAGMGDGVWCPKTQTRTVERICGLVTVGAIHKPPTSIASCVTRGALANTDLAYPGAFLKDEGMAYVSIGGNAILGDNATKEAGKASEDSADALYERRGEGSASKVAFTSYEAVCGKGDVRGDGVVPLGWTKLEGSKHLVLEDVLHSINEAGTTLPTDRWYGSEKVVDRWLGVALEEAGISTGNKKPPLFDLEGLQKWVSGVF